MSFPSKISNPSDYIEPLWHSKSSPYFTDTHRAFASKIRSFVTKEILPYVHKWDEQEKYPPSLRKKAYDAGIYGALWPAKYGGTPFTPDALQDPFYMLIWHDELARCGSGGLMASCFLPNGWGLLPILKHGLQASHSLNRRNKTNRTEEISIKEETILKTVIKGDKTIALCVTEPTAGSDVSNIQTIAKIDENDSNYLRVSGEKYFISNGMNADYLTVAIRIVDDVNGTGNGNKNGKGKGKTNSVKQLAFLLIDVNEANSNQNGKKTIFCSKMKTQGWKAGNTTYIIFKDCKIPKENIIGSYGNGFVPILENFNHGRFAMASTAIRYSRVCLEDAINFAKKRQTFAKRLIDHQVIRHKIVEIARRIESTQSLMEMITYQMKRKEINDRVLGKYMAMVKIEASKTMQFAAREASQIFGGRSYLRGGTASRVERIYREVCVMGIAEGATEILSDLIAKQSKL